MNDTSPEFMEMYRQRIMARTGAERLVMGPKMFDAARSMVLASLPRDLPPHELKKLLFERIYGVPLPSDYGSLSAASARPV